MIRKIKRNMMKNTLKTNDISEAWYQSQVAEYTPEVYCAIRNANRKINKNTYRQVGKQFKLTEKGITTI